MERLSKLQTLAQVVVGMNKVMHDCVAEFLKEHNGLVRVENSKDCSTKDTIYCIYQDLTGDQKDCPVLAVALMGNDQVYILPDLTNGCETIEDVPDSELFKSEEWLPIMGGEVLQNATLYDICAYIEEYV